MRRFLWPIAAAFAFLCPSVAQADASSWLSAGGGYGFKHDDSRSRYEQAGSASFAVGVGTDPHSSVVAGGLFRSTTYFGLGTDLSIALRIATGGFARGQWGLAIDAGPMWRTFGNGEFGRWPIAAMITGGAPWGLQLAVGGELFRIAGNDASAQGLVALIEVDFLRLTVMRQGATDRWWENPSPAGGRPQQQTKKLHPLAGLLF